MAQLQVDPGVTSVVLAGIRADTFVHITSTKGERFTVRSMQKLSLLDGWMDGWVQTLGLNWKLDEGSSCEMTASDGKWLQRILQRRGESEAGARRVRAKT